MASHTAVQQHAPLGTTNGDDTFFIEHGWTRAPRLVQWMTTFRCPLSCEHCLAADGRAADMKAAHAAQLIEQVAAMGVEEFLLTGGEPLVRADLPEIIGMLRANGVRWSLNTALMPDRRVRAAVEKWPPVFVAVSIDGPEAVHDGFRGCPGTLRRALDSIAYFAAIIPGRVAAGTTVTSKNFAHLPATFGIVLESGASQWGLHLPIPEGRAARRKDLFLSAAQLKQLLRFTAAKRNHFPVTLADEIGYCGFWEPLVRNEPFFCGAGKAQCVVLPDGEVVPCTTTDPSASAGNVLRRPLAEIWETGFVELRRWQPRSKCRSCRLAIACQGGCWLQRRHGAECFRNAWRMPESATTIGLAVCLGLAAAGHALGDEAAKHRPPPTPISDAEAARMQVLQSSIVQWYASQFHGRRVLDAKQVKAELHKALPDDPGAKYFLRFAEGKLPNKIEDRSTEIAAALQTQQRSLCLIGIAWRDVTEWCLANESPQRRTDAQRKALCDITVKLGQTAEAWRSEIFNQKLDPFLRRPVQYRGFFASKAGPSASQLVSGKLTASRWSGGKSLANTSAITDQFLAEHPYAETMNLKYVSSEGAALQSLRAGKTADADGILRVFDLLLVPKRTTKPVVLTFPFGNRKLDVTLPDSVQLTYGDVLRLVYEQNLQAFQDVQFDRLMASTSTPVSPLALPELLRRKQQDEAKDKPPKPSRVLWALVDLYLF